MMRSPTPKQKTPLARKTPLKRSGLKSAAGLLRVAAVQATGHAREPRVRKALKSRGMKGRTPTAEESRFMNAIAGLGCIACLKDGVVNPWIVIHHIDGRTKAGAHMLVLPLCAGHHQAGTGEDKTLIAIHPDKARFEARYGTQRELLAECIAMLTNNAEEAA